MITKDDSVLEEPVDQKTEETDDIKLRSSIINDRWVIPDEKKIVIVDSETVIQVQPANIARFGEGFIFSIGSEHGFGKDLTYSWKIIDHAGYTFERETTNYFVIYLPKKVGKYEVVLTISDGFEKKKYNNSFRVIPRPLQIKDVNID